MDERSYGQLLSEIRPRVIDSVEEHERLLAVAERLMEKGDELADEEREVLTAAEMEPVETGSATAVRSA